MKNKRIISLMLVAVVTIGLMTGCGSKTAVNTATNDNNIAEETATASEDESQTENAEDEATSESQDEEKSSDVTIVYTNDVHSYIDNVTKDGDGNVTGDGLRFSKIAAMVKDLRDEGENVLLVDAGDEIQGDIYGAMDEGTTIIDIMRETGYQLATPGNHDFDYGVTQLLKLIETAGFPYVTCNFHSTKTKEIIFSDSYVFEVGDKKVAFVGVSTPKTITSSTPTYFQDEKGEFIYTIDGISDSKDLYTSVQNAIDNVKDDVDYVIGLGHLGVGIDSVKSGWDSKSVISNVSGLDAFIDGHSHTTVEGDIVKDKDGKDVVLTQTGCYLTAVGMMTISADGTITTKLVNDYDREDEAVAKLENDWIDEINQQMNEKIGVLDVPLYVSNPENIKERWIRAKELNLGDFTADSIYWFFNERLGLDCDVAIQNGGGIRSQIDKGDLTYLSAKQVEPFGNMICLIAATGQQIVDALEMGVTVIGEWDDEWNTPAENGGFLQVAGMSYTIDSTVPCGVETDSNKMFDKVNGDYRVRDVKIYNKENGQYEPIELDKTYQLGGINYLLRNSGNGLAMFADDELTVDYVGQDYVILAEYIKNFAGDGEYAHVNTKNCPLLKYDGYLLDYDNPLGSGRINIILE